MSRFAFSICFVFAVTSVLLCFPTAGSVQRARLSQDLERTFTTHEILTINPATFLQQIQLDDRVTLSTAQGVLDIQLEPHEIRATNYRAVAIGDNGATELPRLPVNTYRGRVLNRAGSIASFTISQTKIEGMILTPEATFFLEPAEKFSAAATRDEIVFYAGSAVKNQSLECGATLALQVRQEVNRLKTSANQSTSKNQTLAPNAFGPKYEVELATDADFDYFQIFGGATNQEIISILNDVDAIYESQLGISIRVVFQRVWTTANDPYSGASLSEALNELQTVYDPSFSNSSPPQRDLVHLWTGRNLDGGAGVAFVGVVCSDPDFSYGLSRWQNTRMNEVGLAAHEIGHNFGATHPNAQNGSDCPNSVMADATTPYFCQFSREQITGHVMNAPSCLTWLVQPGCTYTVSPTSQVFSDTGGAANASVTTANGCLWGVAEDRRWIEVTANETGSGNGSFSYSVAPNSGGTRSATLDIGGQALKVFQIASSGCPTTALNFGDNVNGSWTSSDCAFNLLGRPNTYIDRYSFTGNAGQHVAIELNAGSETAAYLVLTAPDGSILAENNFTSLVNTVISRIPANGFLTLPTNGTYFIEAASWVEDSTGPYTLSLIKENLPNAFSFSTVNYQAGESDGSVAIEITRPSGSSGAASINYAATSGTAIAGDDFTATSGTLNFADGQLSKTFVVSLRHDILDEPDETINLTLSNPAGTGLLGVPASAVLTILDDDQPPSLSINDATITEGNSGTSNVTFTLSMTPASGRSVSVNVNTANGTAVAPSDYDAVNTTITFNPGQTTKSLVVAIVGDTIAETTETFSVNLSDAPNANLVDDQGICTISDTDPAPVIQFESPGYSINEDVTLVTVGVSRTGDTSQPASAKFATSDGLASARSDYTSAYGTVSFAAGETSKAINILVSEDSFAEGAENFIVTLSEPSGGATLGSQSSTSVSIIDESVESQTNPIDDSAIFVAQHYHDFLNREPDASGLAFWTNEIEQCGADAGCREIRRINVSAAFFLSIEFQETGYLVYRMDKSAFGDATSPNVPGTVPFVRLQPFLRDAQTIGAGVSVGQGNWQQQLEGNKSSFALVFVQRAEFVATFPLNLSADAFVAKLDLNAGGVLSTDEKSALTAELSAAPADAAKRASVIRKVAEDEDLKRNELRRAFVLMEYFGYLRRTPDDTPDTDFRGWKFWLDKLDQFDGDFVKAEMVKAFIVSDEYRHRFGP